MDPDFASDLRERVSAGLSSPDSLFLELIGEGSTFFFPHDTSWPGRSPALCVCPGNRCSLIVMVLGCCALVASGCGGPSGTVAPNATRQEASITSADATGANSSTERTADDVAISAALHGLRTLTTPPPPPKPSDPSGIADIVTTPAHGILIRPLTFRREPGASAPNVGPNVVSGGASCNGGQCHDYAGPFYTNGSLSSYTGSSLFPEEACAIQAINPSYRWPAAAQSGGASVLYAPTYYADVYTPYNATNVNRNTQEVTTAYFPNSVPEVGVVAKSQYVVMNAANITKYLFKYSDPPNGIAQEYAYYTCILKKGDGLWHAQLENNQSGAFDDISAADQGDFPAIQTNSADIGWNIFEYYLPIGVTCPVLPIQVFSDDQFFEVYTASGTPGGEYELNSAFATTFAGSGGCIPSQYQLTYPSSANGLNYYNVWHS